ncbi:MAG: ABC transporter ATP-binding protein [Pseudomonadota bacterium]
MMSDAPIREPAYLEIEKLAVAYGDAFALDDVSLSVPRGALVSVVGANGAGKTTLIRAIAGMVQVHAGTIRFDGHDITSLSPDLVCEAGIGQVAEGRQIFPSLSVRENLRLGGALRRSRAHQKQNLERVETLFPRLAERRTQRAGSLSGGEQQMLAIARCMMAEPELIMLDEPSLGLSPLLTEQMFDIVRTLNGDGISIMLVEQNVTESLEISDSGYVLENGTVVLDGDARTLLESDLVKKAYLGM